MKQVQITLNEHPLSVRAGMKLFELADLRKPDADLLVLNGFPAGKIVNYTKGMRWS